MFYGGMSNVPGAPGNLMAADPSFRIGPRSPFKGMGQEELNKLKEWDQRPEDLQKYYERINAPGPRLPFAGVGNVGGLVSQLPPGSAATGAGALGGPMMTSPRFGPRPLNLDINAVDNRLESVGGSANIQLDQDQMLRLGGSFNPAYTNEMGIQNPQGYELYGEYTTPSLGVNVNYRNTRGNASAIGGFPGEVRAGFNGRF